VDTPQPSHRCMKRTMALEPRFPIAAITKSVESVLYTEL
jgi:hypothetical protein